MQPYSIQKGLFIKNLHPRKDTILIVFIGLLSNFTWSQCEGFEMTIIFQNPTCYGFSDGSISLAASGGNAPYEYILMDTVGTIIDCVGGIANMLPGGCYVVMITDSLECVVSDTVCLDNPDPITVDLSITPPTYPGACDGIVIAETVYGYQGAYESIGYFWDITGDVVENEVTSVCAGEYTLTINDEFGCSGTVDFALGSLTAISANPKQNIAVSANRSNGQLTVKNPSEKQANLKVVNLAGKVVFESNFNASLSNYSPNLNKGIYLYTIESKQGIIQSGKLVF